MTDGLISSLVGNLLGYLQSIDTSNANWKNDFAAYIRSLTDQSPVDDASNHVAKFSIGEDSDSTEDEVPIDGFKSTSSQCPDDEFQRNFDLTIDDLKKMWKDGVEVCDGDALRLLKLGFAKHRELESRFGNYERAIAVRRAYVAPEIIKDLPFRNYDYKYVVNACCENVIGYIPIPVGVAGPLKVNGIEYQVPMATTEGALIASTNRGASAIFRTNGVRAHVYDDGMTRAPVVQFVSVGEATKFFQWLQEPENFKLVKAKFEENSRFAKLKELRATVDGNKVFVRFVATTGDAMGMNMVSNGCNVAMKFLNERFPEMQLVCLSGNMCVDKKASAINWIQGRGKSVVAECTISAQTVMSVLKTTPEAMARAAYCKLEAGPSRSGSLGGSNAHAANIVAAIFLATGQDAAQVVSSSMCHTEMTVQEGSLYVTCTMPCLEVGTVGGGTILPPQNNCLKMLNCAGASPVGVEPGTHAYRLAEIIAATVIAGELSLMAALVTDDLVSSHLKLNRSRLNLYPERPTASDDKINQLAHRKKKNSERGANLRPECSNIL